MDPGDAMRLQERWKKKGSPPCAHESLSRERVSGPIKSNDYICTTCGAEGWGPDWPSKDRARFSGSSPAPGNPFRSLLGRAPDPPPDDPPPMPPDDAPPQPPPDDRA